MDAIDLMKEGKVKIAFALKLSHGHNSGYFSPKENSLGTSGRSCIVNNITIEVPYAKFKYQNETKKQQ